MDLYKVLKALCLAPSPSGYEKNAAKVFASEVSKYADDVKLDKMGSVIAKISGTDDSAPIVMAYAHMDQLGFIVRKITEDGYVQVDRMGGIPEKVLPALRLLIRTKNGDFVPGVFGNKAHHATLPEEKYKVDLVTSLNIDVGLNSRKEVNEMGIDIGCPIVYEPSLIKLE